MRPEDDVYLYQDTLVHYRDKAKATVEAGQPGSEEHTEAVKMFYRCDGAIQILNWVLENEANTVFNLPPIAQRSSS